MRDPALRDSSFDGTMCWLCDNAWVLLASLMMLAAAYYLRQRGLSDLVPPATPVGVAATASPTINAPTPTDGITATPATTPTPTSTPTPSTYIIAFVPVHWKGSRDSFLAAAKQHADLFVKESNISAYVRIEIKYISQTFKNTPLNSEDLLPDLLEFALKAEPADRYVGLTDDDIAVRGNRSVSGYTFGLDYQAIIAESKRAEITAHELGHTYGLCDEYSYAAWKRQNVAYNGCPNPYPPECPKIENVAELCDGHPANDGRNSMMGPSGQRGAYTYNTESYNHLQTMFAKLFRRAP
jgi:hypothetical protein